MSEVRKLERFNKKTAPQFFKLTEGYPPRTVPENYEKNNKKIVCNEN